MTRPLTLIVLLSFLAFGVSAQMPGDLPVDGLLSAEESLRYIEGLSTRGLNEECVTQASFFLERYPGHPFTEAVEAWRIQGLFELKKYPDAATAIQEHLQKFPNSANRTGFLWYLGECLRNTGDYANALPAYEDMLKIAKGDQAEEARYRLAACLGKLGRLDEAKKHLQILAELPPNAKHLPRIYARHFLATLLQRDGEANAALEIYQPLLEISGLPNELRQSLLLDAAYIAFNPPIQNYQMAGEYYGTFLMEYPNAEQATTVRINLLSCHFALAHYQDFLELYQRLSQNAPEALKDPELNWLYIRSLVAVQRFSEALPRLKTLLQDTTLNASRRQQASQYLIQCLEVLRQDNELVEKAKKYCEDYPNALDANSVMLSAICAEERLGKNAEAIADLEVLLPKLAAGSPVLFQRVGRELARLFTQTGEFKRSADLFLELAEKAPDSSNQEDFLTKRQLQLAALTPLFQLPTDPRGLALAKQLSNSANDPEERAQLLQTRYQFALHEGKPEEALEAIATALPLATPLQEVNWILLRAQVHRQLKQFNETANDYIEVLKHRECTDATKSEVMPILLALLYYTNRNEEAASLLPALFSMTPQPKLSQQLLFQIAHERMEATDYDNARKALNTILESPNLKDDDREFFILQAALVESFAKCFDNALEILKKCDELRSAKGKEQPSDALALLGEIELQKGNFNEAFLYARQALTLQDRPILSDTIPRARWTLAKALLEKGNNADAFTTATQVFLLEKHPRYSPLAYWVAIQAKERQGDQAKADELRRVFREEYPDFVLP